jgi:hypothetical protein
MTSNENLERAYEIIDAALFSGDTFLRSDRRERLRYFVSRWERQIDVMVNTAQRIEDEESVL